MQEAGVNTLVLTDGSKVEVKPFYAAKIPESRTQEAFSWLRDKGYGDLIKNQITASFNRGQDNLASELIKVCNEHGFRYVSKRESRTYDVKSFCKRTSRKR